MRILAVILLVMSSCVAFADILNAPSKVCIEVSYSFGDCSPDHADMLIMDLTESQIVVQDLGFGKIILAASDSKNAPVIIPFPENLLSLHFSESGSIFALTRKGFIKFADLTETLNWMQAKSEIQNEILLREASLDLDRSVYRLYSDSSENMAVWNRSESLLQIFSKSGNFIDAFPCPSNPVLTGRKSFISSFFSPEIGSRLIEIGFDRPIENGAQKETDGLFLEIRSPLEFQIVAYNSLNDTFEGLLLPPQPENSAISNEAQNISIDDIRDNEKLSQNSVETESGDSGNGPGYYSSIDKSGEAKILMKLQEANYEGKIKRAGDTVYCLMPEYECSSETAVLKRILILPQKIVK